MRRIPFCSSVVPSVLLLAIVAASAAAQTAGVPAISQRAYVSGSAKVTYTGAGKMDEEIPLNTKASYSDGSMTWLQFGASGAAEPNALITYNAESGETGVTAARGKFGVIAGIMAGDPSSCTGKATVTATSIVGEYKCVGATTYDSGSGSMGKVDMTIKFTAGS
jgi:hypothetical protein